MNETYLEHHGILGQKWGVRHGPPYPLDYGSHSSEEKRKNPRSRIGGGNTGSKRKRKSTGDRVTKLKKKNDYSKVPTKAASVAGGSGRDKVSAKEKLRRAMVYSTATAAEIPSAIKREAEHSHEWDSIGIQSKLAREQAFKAKQTRDYKIAKQKIGKGSSKGFLWRYNKTKRDNARYAIQMSDKRTERIINEALEKGFNIEVRDVKRYAVGDKIKSQFIIWGMPTALISMWINRKEAMQDSKSYYVKRTEDGKKGKLEEKDTVIPKSTIDKSIANPGPNQFSKSTSKKAAAKDTDLSKVPVKSASMFGGGSGNSKTPTKPANEKTTVKSSNNKAPSKSELTRRLQSNDENDVNIALSYLSGLAERDEISKSEFNKLVGIAAKKYEIGVVDSIGGRYLMVYGRKKK